MTFQMQRTAFIDGILMKKQHKHPISSLIYPDRFMYRNRVEIEALRKKVSTLRAKITLLKDCLERYTNFNGSNIGINTAFDQVLHFFSA